MLVVCHQSHAEWAESSDALAIKPLPSNAQRQVQNPPSFSWSRHPSNPASYIIEIQGGGTTTTATVNRNWYLPVHAFVAGQYSWRVRPSTSTDWSTSRKFVIDVNSDKFEVPESANLRATVMSHARPHGLPISLLSAGAWSADMKTERSVALTRLSNDVLRIAASEPPIVDAKWSLNTVGVMSAANDAQNADIRKHVNIVGRQLEAASLLYRLTGDSRFLDEAFTRGDQLAKLNPSGPTSNLAQDQGNRQIALSLMKAFDFLTPHVVSDRRAAWLKSVRERTNEMYKDLSGSDGRMDQFPFDSHGETNLGYLSLISTLALGDIPEAADWFDFSFRAYANSIYPWSGPEGGFANGTAYAQYTADSALQLWQPLREATGVNLFGKPWAKGFLQYFIQFLPPGAKSHVFGDQHEMTPDPRLLKAYASRFASPSAAWYVKNLNGDEDSLSLLQARFPLPVTSIEANQPQNSGYFSSIGWVAMHSDIADRAQTSLYVKSSPFGSFNHSHGDQNSFVLSTGGRGLLIEAGSYDWYNSPLWNNWYRQSKAHNVVTFDGGQGQRTEGYRETLERNGKIDKFSSSATLDYVDADATPAYGGALTQAKRQTWYLRGQDVVLIHDALQAPLAHSFEWNLHAPVPITAAENGRLRITNVDRSLCIESLGTSPITYKPMTGPAPKAGSFEAHGAYVTAPAKSAEFLMLLDVGCKNPAVSVTVTASGRTVHIGDQAIEIAK
jgi:hypothetical protein